MVNGECFWLEFFESGMSSVEWVLFVDKISVCLLCSTIELGLFKFAGISLYIELNSRRGNSISIPAYACFEVSNDSSITMKSETWMAFSLLVDNYVVKSDHQTPVECRYVTSSVWIIWRRWRAVYEHQSIDWYLTVRSTLILIGILVAFLWFVVGVRIIFNKLKKKKKK